MHRVVAYRLYSLYTIITNLRVLNKRAFCVLPASYSTSANASMRFYLVTIVNHIPFCPILSKTPIALSFATFIWELSRVRNQTNRLPNDAGEPAAQPHLIRQKTALFCLRWPSLLMSYKTAFF